MEYHPQVLKLNDQYNLILSSFIIVISIKSTTTSLYYEGICIQSTTVQDFKKCVDDLRKPFIHKIQLKSYKQSYVLEKFGMTDFIHPGKHSITEESSPRLFLNKVSFNLSTIFINFWRLVTGILFVLF